MSDSDTFSKSDFDTNLPVELQLEIIKNLLNDSSCRKGIETFKNLCITNKRLNEICKYNFSYLKNSVYKCLLNDIKSYLSTEMVKNFNDLPLYLAEKISNFIFENKNIFEESKEHSSKLRINVSDDVGLFYKDNSKIFAKYILDDKNPSSSIGFLNFIINYPASYLETLKLNLERWRNGGEGMENDISDVEIIMKSQKIKLKNIKDTLLNILVILFKNNQNSKKVSEIINYILKFYYKSLQTVYDYPQLIDYFDFSETTELTVKEMENTIYFFMGRYNYLNYEQLKPSKRKKIIIFKGAYLGGITEIVKKIAPEMDKNTLNECLDNISYQGYYDIIEYFIKYPDLDWEKAIKNTIYKDFQESFKLIFTNIKWDKNQVKKIFLVAVKEAHVDIIKYLVSVGILNKKDYQEAYDISYEWKRTHLMDYFQSLGATPKKIKNVVRNRNPEKEKQIANLREMGNNTFADILQAQLDEEE